MNTKEETKIVLRRIKEDIAFNIKGYDLVLPDLTGSRSEEYALTARRYLQTAFDNALQAERLFTE